MKNSLWKYIGIATITAHSVVFLTFISRLYPQLAFILFLLAIVALIILLQFFEDLQDEDIWVKGLIVAIALIAVLVGNWDFILIHSKEITDWLIVVLGIFGGVVIGGIVHVINKRFGNSRQAKK